MVLSYFKHSLETGSTCNVAEQSILLVPERLMNIEVYLYIQHTWSLIESSKDAPVESLSFSPDNSCLAAAIGASFVAGFLQQQRC